MNHRPFLANNYIKSSLFPPEHLKPSSPTSCPTGAAAWLCAAPKARLKPAFRASRGPSSRPDGGDPRAAPAFGGQEAEGSRAEPQGGGVAPRCPQLLQSPRPVTHTRVRVCKERVGGVRLVAAAPLREPGASSVATATA